MKYTKKLLSLVLVLVLALALAVPGFAATTTPQATNDQGEGSITINGAISGKTYSIYRIFDLSYDSTNRAYTYTLSDAWDGFLSYSKSDDAVSNYVTANTQGYISWKTDVPDDADTVAGLAALAMAYAEEKNILAVASVQADVSGAQFNRLKLGYYLVDSSTGALCSLNTTDTSIDIEEKNEVPGIDKTVVDTGAGVGAIVNYTITIDAKDGAEGYLVHDTMENVELVGAPTVTYYATKQAATEGTGGTRLTDGTQYNFTEETSDNCAFHITFAADYCATLANGNTIVITYQARITENAVIEGASNDVDLDYGSDGKAEIETPVTTNLYKFDVFKYTTVDGVQKPLSSAIFSLDYVGTSGNEDVVLYAKDAENMEINGEQVAVPVYYMCDDSNCSQTTHTHVTAITTDENGRFIIKGLPVGTYQLSEDDSPDGYNQLTEAITVTIGADGAVSYEYEDKSYENDTVAVENLSGTRLPSTGGMGTTIFYTLGGVLVVGAAILLVTKKRVHDVEG